MPEPHPDFDLDEEPITGPVMSYRRGEDIEPTKPSWLWDRWLCVGALHLLVSRQGSGKTTFASWALGQLTVGKQFPDGSTAKAPVTCAILSLEEPADLLVARLHATGADVAQVLVLGLVWDVDSDGHPYQRPWQLPRDCTPLETMLRDKGVRFLVVDGLGYSIAGDGSYSVVGSALSALAGVAERTGCAILGLTHTTEGRQGPVTAAIGSTAWTALARIVWVLGIHPEDETGTQRVVRVSKSNSRCPMTDSGS